MILYFDNYITDQPFHGKIHDGLEKIRSSPSVYKFQNKLKITLYTLASYAEIEWSEVIIKYELENIKQKKEFEREVKKLFPKAYIIYGRSDNQRKFQESVKIMNTFKDEWIFYAGNNDHPFMAPNKNTLNACLKKAKVLKKKHKWVSIIISHFTVFYNSVRKGNPFYEINNRGVKFLEADKNCIVALYPKGEYHSMQIIHKDLLNHWFFYKDAGDTLIRRSEDIIPFTKRKDQIVIIPKKEICTHFDGEIHTDKTAFNLEHDLFPPLFIPSGFFKKNVKIAFGYDKYRKGWVNINPLIEKYSFEDLENGTDLKIGLEEIPLFWKEKIKKIDINPKLDKRKIKAAVERRNYNLRNPFPKKSNIYWIVYRSKTRFFREIYKIKLFREPILNLMNNNNSFRNFYIRLIKISFK